MFSAKLKTALLVTSLLSLSVALSQNRSINITAGGFPSQSSKDEYNAIMALKAKFEAANPGVTITGREGYYDRDTFPAKLAANTLETTFMVPFTDPPGLIARGQVADISGLIRGWRYAKSFNPSVLKLTQDAQGRNYGLVRSGYALGLVYNRRLFREAGLDPNKPPTTWAQVREYAKKLTNKNKGQAGFMQLSKDNGGGWMFTAYYTTFGGGDLVRQVNGKWQATFNNPTGVAVLQMLKDMRWKDQSLTDRVLLSYGDYTQLMASGRVGMMIYPADVVATIVTQYGANINDFGAGAMPQQGGNATLSGGDAFMFNPKASPEQLRTAFNWQLYSLYNLTSYENQQAALAKAKQPVGIPALSIFTGELEAQRQAILKKYVNVPLANYRGYKESLTRLQLKAEPAVEAQKMYAALDTAVQSILTNQDADPKALLAAAADQYTKTVLDPLNR